MGLQDFTQHIDQAYGLFQNAAKSDWSAIMGWSSIWTASFVLCGEGTFTADNWFSERQIVRRQLLFATFLVTAVPISTAKADFTSGLINVDFNFTPQAATQTGASTFGAAGDVWNPEFNFDAHTSGILNLATGNPSNNVTYSLNGVNHAIIGATAFLFTPLNPLMGDAYIVSPAKTMTVSFNGLSPLQPYDLYFYSSAA